MTPREILNREYGNSKNFMTPQVLGRGLIHKDANFIVVYELSKGRGILPPFPAPVIYGLTVVEYDCKNHTTCGLHKIGKCSEYKSDITNYIKKLKKSWHVYRNNCKCS